MSDQPDQPDQPQAGPDGTPSPTPDEPGSASPGRRRFLGGVLGVLGVAAGAGVGVGVGFARRLPRPQPHLPPADLLAARATESRLLDGVAALERHGGAAAGDLTQLRRDHEAHRQVIDSALSHYDPASPAARRRAATAAGPAPDDAAGLRDAERAAARAAAARAGRLAAAEPELATVFASIAACETTHAELLA